MQPDTAVHVGYLWPTLQPFVVELIGTILTGLFTWLSIRIHKWIGVQIDEKHMRALHSAAMTGLNLALTKAGTAASALTINTRSATVAEAANWMISSVPDALAHFGLSDPSKADKLLDFVSGKLGAIESSANVAVTAGGTSGAA